MAQVALKKAEKQLAQHDTPELHAQVAELRAALGTAQQALERYSKRLNVAATLALAGVGMQRTLVQVVIDPKVSGNEHHLKVSSPLGHMLFKLSNEPAPGGSGTSWVVAHSIVAAVKRRFNSRMAVV